MVLPYEARSSCYGEFQVTSKSDSSTIGEFVHWAQKTKPCNSFENKSTLIEMENYISWKQIIWPPYLIWDVKAYFLDKKVGMG